MKCLLTTEFKMAKVEVSDESILVKGGESFKVDEGTTINEVLAKYTNKKYIPKLKVIKE